MLPEVIEKSIFLIRGQKVLLDFVLAQMYEVETKKLIQAVKRNTERFPKDFMFQLTEEEARVFFQGSEIRIRKIFFTFRSLQT